MKMRTVVELSEKDIIQIIANAFDVDIHKVSLKYSEVLRGYAQNEHIERVFSASVVLKSGGANND